jgi:hypothetical protein
MLLQLYDENGVLTKQLPRNRFRQSHVPAGGAMKKPGTPYGIPGLRLRTGARPQNYVLGAGLARLPRKQVL